ncbi:MAG: 16S rRNA (cytidine(1402)-2'-O)-methyltransferase [Xenococcaceae cyanobacterium]
MSKQAEQNTAILYVVGTPIGNLEDISLRALRILKTVDLIAAEDTRHTGKLLQHYQINVAMISYHEHNKLSRLPELLDHLKQEKTVALVTDAGMPGISDPGYDLIAACIVEKITVIPIPGATAAIAALVASGLPTDRFVFEGFLPTKDRDRQERLQLLDRETRTIIFYEAPHRLVTTLEDLAVVFGKERQIVLARELTKLYEEFWRGNISEAIALYSETRQPKGEFTIVVGGVEVAKTIEMSEEDLKTELKLMIEEGISRSQASRQLAQITSRSRRELYQLALKIELD